MDGLAQNSADVAPEIRQRACGGWLALAPHGSGLIFGVTGQTQEQARDRFAQSRKDWIRALRNGN